MVKIRIGTRGSELALRQAALVAEALGAVCGRPEVQIVPICTAGDERTDIPLHAVNRATGCADKGVFVKAIDDALAAGEVDCAVHSGKDMPGMQDARFDVAAVLPRGPINDVLVLKPGGASQALRIGTGSVRRIRQAEVYWSGRARLKEIRGNVPTRLRRLVEDEQLDALLLARAGLERLGYGPGRITVQGRELLQVDMDCGAFMPAPCQGMIVTECRAGDDVMRGLLRGITHAQTELCLRAERAFLAELRADCSVPVAGYAELRGSELMFRAMYFGAGEGWPPLRLTRCGSADDPEALGRVSADEIRDRLS